MTKIKNPLKTINDKMPKGVRKGIKVGIISLTVITILLTCYMLICNIVAVRKERPVSYFGYSYSYVPTDSMYPAIKAGDSIIFKDVSYDEVLVGDIIVYKSSEGETKGLYIVHRVIEIRADGIIVKGDNNPIADDEIVTESKLIGKYVRTFNLLNIGKLASNKSIIYGILVIFFAIIILSESVNIYLMKNKNRLKENIKTKSESELKNEVLEEMRQELLKEIEEENKKKNEDV